MMAGYNGGSGNSQLYLSPTSISEGEDDGISSISSEGSVLISHNYESIYDESANGYIQHSYPVPDPVSAAAMALVPVGLLPAELDIEDLYGLQDCQRKYNISDKANPAHVNSRRRAQNRASQKAFRDRKEKRMKETEEKLIDLQERHNELMQSYKRVQLECLVMKQEMEKLRGKSEDIYPVPIYFAEIEGWPRPDHSDPLLFDVSTFCYEPEEDIDRVKG